MTILIDVHFLIFQTKCMQRRAISKARPLTTCKHVGHIGVKSQLQPSKPTAYFRKKRRRCWKTTRTGSRLSLSARSRLYQIGCSTTAKCFRDCTFRDRFEPTISALSNRRFKPADMNPHFNSNQLYFLVRKHWTKQPGPGKHIEHHLGIKLPYVLKANAL